MNQILSTENINDKQKRSKKTGTKDINSVVKFFAIGIFIFGLFLIVNSSYAMLKGNTKKEKTVSSEPTIEIEMKGEDKILLKVMHEENIAKVTYSWNEQNPTIIEPNNKFVQKEIEIPNGENTLYVTAVDVNGAVKKEEKDFELSLSTNIDIEISGNNIKINLEGKNQIKEFTYAWDEEEEKTIEVNDTKYAMEIEAPLGTHELKVKAIDENGEEEEKTQKVVGTKKPTVKIKQGDNAYIFEAYDEIGLDRIEITTADGKVTKIETDGKEFEYKFPVKESSENYVEVVAYNKNEVKSKKARAKWPK